MRAVHKILFAMSYCGNLHIDRTSNNDSYTCTTMIYLDKSANEVYTFKAFKRDTVELKWLEDL